MISLNKSHFDWTLLDLTRFFLIFEQTKFLLSLAQFRFRIYQLRSVHNEPVAFHGVLDDVKYDERIEDEADVEDAECIGLYLWREQSKQTVQKRSVFTGARVEFSVKVGYQKVDHPEGGKPSDKKQHRRGENTKQIIQSLFVHKAFLVVYELNRQIAAGSKGRRVV